MSDPSYEVRTFFLIMGHLSEITGVTSFKIRDYPDLFNKTRTFSEIRGPHSKLTVPIYFGITHLPDLLSEKRTFSKIGELIVN